MAQSYKSAHLAWIHSTKNFTPKYAGDYRSDISYYEVMKHLYQNPNVTEDYAKLLFIQDKVWFQQSFKVSKEIDNIVKKLEPTANSQWFLTIGFNHQTWSISKCCKVIENILAMEWIKKAKANFELYRENGEHPHCHFFIETDLPKSKILEKVFRPLYVKEVVLSKSFIDLKQAGEYHLKYIKLDKQEAKLQYIDKDKLWRAANGIPDYEKNWS